MDLILYFSTSGGGLHLHDGARSDGYFARDALVSQNGDDDGGKVDRLRVLEQLGLNLFLIHKFCMLKISFMLN